MSYTHTTRGDLKTQLSLRLGDPGRVHWIDAEQNLLITEALRTYGLFTGMWRDHGVLPTRNLTPFYDLNSETSLASLIGYSVTDRDTLGLMQYMLTEPYDPTAGAGMSDQFTFAGMTAALQRARNQFIDDTMLPVTLLPILVAAGQQDVALPDTTIDVRRAVWRTTQGYYSNIHKSSESEASFRDTSYLQSPGIPDLYTILAAPQLTLRLIPAPIDTGTLELVVVASGANLTPATAATVMGIPDDTVWCARELALADLLGRDGPAQDLARAAACRGKYEFAVAVVNSMSQVLTASISEQSVVPSSVADIDMAYASPHWQSQPPGKPRDVGVMSGNMLALRPIPNGVYGVGLDLVRKTPIPANDGDPILLGREQIDAVLDCAESYALFKMGGSSVGEYDRLFGSMVASASRYNGKLAVDGYRAFMQAVSHVEEGLRPERTDASQQAAGALSGGPKDGGGGGS